MASGFDVVIWSGSDVTSQAVDGQLWLHVIGRYWLGGEMTPLGVDYILITVKVYCFKYNDQNNDDVRCYHL